MANDEQLAVLKQGRVAWNNWVNEHRANRSAAGAVPPSMRQGFRIDLTEANLSGTDLSGMYLGEADLSRANLSRADLSEAELAWACLAGANLYEANLKGALLLYATLPGADLSRANLSRADLSGVVLDRERLLEANLSGAKLIGASLRGTHLSNTDLSGAVLQAANLSEANLYEADLRRASLQYANLTGAHLSRANISGADLREANLSQANVTSICWNPRQMRGKYLGVRGLDSCYGNALFKRSAADQDFLDTLETVWRGTWRIWLFGAWSCLDYGRSISRVAAFAIAIIFSYGLVFSVWRGLLDYGDSDTWFSPFYFSIVTFTTLGFGDIKPYGVAGELLASSEVIIGYINLGLLLAVLAEKLARRS